MIVFPLLLVPPLVAAVCWALGPRRSEAVHVAGVLLTLVLGVTLAADVLAGHPLSAGRGAIYVDALGALVLLIVAVIGCAAGLYSVGYLRTDMAQGEAGPAQARWYYPAFHLFLGTMLATPVLNNLGLVWVAVEATTLASVPLVAFYRTNAALEAAWKYVLLCTVGLVIALFGVVLLYYAAQSAGVGLAWTELRAAAAGLDPHVMRLAFVFALAGFGAKAGFAPLHTWLPDAHSQAPSPVSALLSGVQLNCALYAILRFYVLTSEAVGGDYASRLLIGFGLLSVVVAVPFILVQRDLKRLLAYSSVEHVGLIALAVGLGGPVGLYAGVLHMVNHAVTKSLLFFVAGDLTQTFHTHRISRIRGAVVATPATGALLVAGSLAISGAPPFGVFLSEFGVLNAAFGRHHYVVAGALIAALALVFVGFAVHLGEMAFGRPTSHEPLPRARLSRALVFLPPLVVMVALGVWAPPGMTDAVGRVTTVLGG